MKKLISILTIIALIFAVTGCSIKPAPSATAEDANQFLTTFFSSYSMMNTYLKSPDIAISAFALDGQGLSGILKAVYQAQSVSFTFPIPTKTGEGTFSVPVEVSAPNIEPLYDMYAIDRELSGGDLPDNFVGQSFYDNIRAGTTNTITTTVNIAVSYLGGEWKIAPSNELALAIFPNIANAN